MAVDTSSLPEDILRGLFRMVPFDCGLSEESFISSAKESGFVSIYSRLSCEWDKHGVLMPPVWFYAFRMERTRLVAHREGSAEAVKCYTNMLKGIHEFWDQGPADVPEDPEELIMCDS